MMSRVSDKSDDEYAVIGNKADIGFIDVQNCQSVCSYNPSAESSIVNISVPFALVEKKPRSGFVGEIICDSVTIENLTDETLELWKVSIWDAKPEDSFTISVKKPPTQDSDVEYIQEFMEVVSLEDRFLSPRQTLTIWLSCKPKELGLHTAAVHFSVGDETLERLVFVLAEDKISQSLSAVKSFYRAGKKKQAVVDAFSEDPAVTGGACHSRTSNWGFRNLPEYRVPSDIRDIVKNKQVPPLVSKGLTRESYGPFFKTLLAMEEIKLEEDMQTYDMECVTLKSSGRHLLSLVVPGLAERRPSLVNGDFIFAKLASGPETQNAAYKGSIHRVEAEEIYLKFHRSFHSRHRDSNLYNVRFTYNRIGMRRMYQAVEAAGNMEADFLFPTVFSRRRLIEPKPFVPISLMLNQEQMTAVNMILSCKGGSPYVIHGPPGTGKTMTLVESILQIYNKRRNARILVCAPSNSASDHMLERLIGDRSKCIEKTDILRLNAISRTFDDVNEDHLAYCCYEDSIFRCPAIRELVRYRIIISTYTSAFLLYAAGIKRGHFSHIFLDEAGQASEPESMVPLSHLQSKSTVTVLSGDPMQLGPIVLSKDAEYYGLGTSYLERLFAFELYSSGDKNYVTKLVRNYRSDQAILYLPSELFYNGELIPCKEKSGSSSPSWENFLPNKDFPVLFFGLQGCDEREGSNPSWFNRIEASKVIEMVQGLIVHSGVDGEQIGVITPYKQQVLKIRGALERFGMPDIEVGSVEQFQGREREVIIISTVRSTVKHNEFDRAHYLGFLSNPKRFNVAITRAKSLLIVIGNPHILCKDFHWNKILWYCVDNGSYKGCFLPERQDINEEERHFGPFNAPSGAVENDFTSGQPWGGIENDFRSSDEPWIDDNWQSSDVPWGDMENNFQSSNIPWDDGENSYKQSDVAWLDSGNNFQSTDSPGADGENNFQPSDVPWNVTPNNSLSADGAHGKSLWDEISRQQEEIPRAVHDEADWLDGWK